jgi:hypothetical protein
MVRLAYGTATSATFVTGWNRLISVGYRIIFETEENPAINCKLGMHYNTFSG